MSKGDEPSIDMKQMEKWLESMFLDPLTSYLDQMTFRIDIFDTNGEYIIEALLSNCDKSDIKVDLKGNEIEINVTESKCMSRKIDFPFNISKKDVHAKFSNGILEIFISKINAGSGCNRSLKIL